MRKFEMPMVLIDELEIADVITTSCLADNAANCPAEGVEI